jgi:hypothetical protein
MHGYKQLVSVPEMAEILNVPVSWLCMAGLASGKNRSRM